MALIDLRHLICNRDDTWNQVADDAHADEGADRKPDLLVVDFGAVADDNTGLFHATNALDHSWIGKPDASPQFGILNAGVLLKLGQNAPPDGVEEPCNF